MLHSAAMGSEASSKLFRGQLIKRGEVGRSDLGPVRLDKVSLYLPRFIAQLGNHVLIRKLPLFPAGHSEIK
jgi:hypothetical protein